MFRHMGGNNCSNKAIFAYLSVAQETESYNNIFLVRARVTVKTDSQVGAPQGMSSELKRFCSGGFILAALLLFGCVRGEVDPTIQLVQEFQDFMKRNPSGGTLYHSAGDRSGVFVIASPHVMNSNDSIAELTETVGEKATKRIQSLSAMRELNQLYFVTQDGRVYGGVWNPSPVGFNNLFVVPVKPGDTVNFEIENKSLRSVKVD